MMLLEVKFNLSFVVYNASIGLFSLLGLMCKAFVIDTCIESLNLNKYFTIICRNPDAVCRMHSW